MILKNPDNRISVFLFFLAFLLYANTLQHGYTWDDSIVITENARVQKGITNVADLFVKYNSEYKSDKYGYRPITLTSFALDISIFGFKAWGGHLMQLLYFSLLCVVLYRMSRKIFYRYSNLVPFLITLLFIVHPVHTEVVANIKSRDEIFALLFGLLALNQFIRYMQQKKWKFLLYGSALFLMAFLSKESAIAFLGIIPLTLYYMDENVPYKKLLPPLAAIVFLGMISILIVNLYTGSKLGKSFSEGAGIYHESGILGNSFLYSGNWGEKLANAFCVLALYAKNFFVPLRQLYYYGYNQIPVAHWNDVLVLCSAVAHVAALGFAILKFKKYREISYGILFYFISIFIYTHLLRALADTMADRFLFTPSLGLAIVTVFLLQLLFKVDFTTAALPEWLSSRNRQTNGLKYGTLVLLVLLGIKTLSRNADWKNNETLMTHDMPYLENCSRAHQYYADILRDKLSVSYNASTEASMIAHYIRSFEITGEAYYARLGLGRYYCSVKNYAAGIAVLEKLVSLFPEQADPNFYLGEALFHTGRYKEAVVYLYKSRELAPAILSTYYFLALAYSKDGATAKAVNTIEQARQKFGESGLIYDALGNIYFDAGDMATSTRFTFEQLRFGEDPQKVYGTVIGRYQFKKSDKAAAFYYEQALAKGIFKRP